MPNMPLLLGLADVRFSPNPWPYTPEERRRILEALKPSQSADSAEILEHVSALSGYRRDCGPAGPKPFEGLRLAAKDRVTVIKRTAERLSRLLQDDLLAEGTTWEVTYTGLDWKTLRDAQAQLTLLTDEATKAKNEWSKAGRPRNRATALYVAKLLDIWLSEHPSYKRGIWTRGIPEFVQACIAPVLSAKEQQQVLGSLETYKREAKLYKNSHPYRRLTQEQQLLAMKYFDLAEETARQERGRPGAKWIDLDSVAAAALIDAARHYDPDYGTPFEIYAQIYMRDSIRGAIARNAAANANTQTVGRAAVARMRERAPEDFAGD